jgi:hypothetical protein
MHRGQFMNHLTPVSRRRLMSLGGSALSAAAVTHEGDGRGLPQEEPRMATTRRWSHHVWRRATQRAKEALRELKPPRSTTK